MMTLFHYTQWNITTGQDSFYENVYENKQVQHTGHGYSPRHLLCLQPHSPSHLTQWSYAHGQSLYEFDSSNQDHWNFDNNCFHSDPAPMPRTSSPVCLSQDELCLYPTYHFYFQMKCDDLSSLSPIKLHLYGDDDPQQVFFKHSVLSQEASSNSKDENLQPSSLIHNTQSNICPSAKKFKKLIGQLQTNSLLFLHSYHPSHLQIAYVQILYPTLQSHINTLWN